MWRCAWARGSAKPNVVREYMGDHDRGCLKSKRKKSNMRMNWQKPAKEAMTSETQGPGSFF